MRTLLIRLRERTSWKWILGIAVVLLLVGKFWIGGGEDEVDAKEEEVVKQLEIVSFAEWTPEGSREVLARIESTGDVDINAEVSGTIEDVLVDIGDEVISGQVLARYRQSDDATQIGYINALNSLDTARLASQSSVLNAEMTLQTAKAELEQTKRKEAQSYNEVYDALLVKTENATTKASNALNWADQMIGVSTEFRYRNEVTRSYVGSNQKRERQQAFDMIDTLLREKAIWNTLSQNMPEMKLLSVAENRLNFLRKLQQLLRLVDDMIRKTNLSQNFSETNREAFRAEAETFTASIDAEILSLNSQIETARSEKESNSLSILAVENKVKNAESALKLAQANANSSVSSAQNQVRLAASSQSDLEVKAPFSGRISAREIADFNQVTTGEKLFSLVAGEITPKVTGYFTKDEVSRLLTKDSIQIRLANGETVETSSVLVSSKTDPETQKVEVEFHLDKPLEDMEVGSFAKVLIPIQNGKKNLLPITAISFEPGGAEVLILNTEGKAERRAVEFGKIISDAIEIVSGLEEGERVIRHRNRAHAGERINPSEQ